jgi:CheY-like chemotaxis protein
MKTPAVAETISPARILLVDDSKLGLLARKAVLEEQGHRITTAPEGVEALEQFTRDRFDLIITDYRMPRMNGLELIRKVRELDSNVPIILISGYAEALGLTEANTGADAVIPKSSHEVQQLVRWVNRLLRRPAPKKPMASQAGKAKSRTQTA